MATLMVIYTIIMIMAYGCLVYMLPPSLVLPGVVLAMFGFNWLIRKELRLYFRYHIRDIDFMDDHSK